jgi:hypothetical protein
LFTLIEFDPLGRVSHKSASQNDAARNESSDAHEEASLASPSTRAEASTTVEEPGESKARAPALEGPSKSRFRGRLVYESTRDPVPWCLVSIRAQGCAAEARIASEDGRFATAFEYPAGSISLTTTDAWGEPDAPMTVDHAPASATEVEIALRMWPTYVLETDTPDGFDATHANCRLRGSYEGFGTPFDVNLVSPRRGTFFWRRGSIGIHDGREELERVRAGGPPWTFTAWDQGSMWSGAASADRFDGVVRLAVDWKRLGALHVDLQTNLDRSPNWDVTGELRGREAGHESQLKPIASGNLAREASLEFERIPPGAFTLSVRTRFCETVEMPVTIRAGETATVRASLPCAPPAGAIRGVITSETGTFHGASTEVTLYLGTETFDRRTVAWNQRDGAWVGSYRFDDLPSRDYMVKVRTESFPARSEHESAAHPAEQVDFVVLDSVPTYDIGFVVTEAGTGRVLDDFEIRVSQAGSQGPRIVRSGEIAIHGASDGVAISWDIEKAEYLCAHGTLADAARSWRVDGDRRWVNVAVVRGFRMTVSARDAASRALEGATVVVDGLDAGVTDVHGEFEISRDETPTSIDVRYRDWRVRGVMPGREQPFRPCSDRYFTLAPP